MARSRPYQPPQFFRVVPRRCLAAYFHRRGWLEEIAIATLPKPKGHSPDPVYAAWLKLPSANREQSTRDFLAINRLACASGLEHIIRLGHHEGVDLVPHFEKMSGYHEKVFHTFLEYPHLFQLADKVSRLDGLSRRYWYRRNDLPAKRIEHIDTCVAELAEAIKAYLRLQGRGYECLVEALELDGRLILVAYPEDFPQAQLEWKGQNLESVVHRPICDLAYNYEPHSGAVEIYYKGPQAVREELLVIFARTVLGIEVPLRPTSHPAYDLNPLRDREFQFNLQNFPEVEDIRVYKLRFRLLGSTEEYSLKVCPDQNRYLAYDRLEQIVAGLGGSLALVNLQEAAFKAYFKEVGTHGHTTKSFSLSHPHTCSLDHEGRDALLRRILLNSPLEIRQSHAERESVTAKWPHLLRSSLLLAEGSQGAGSLLTGEDLARWPAEWVAACRQAGWIGPAPPNKRIICPGCEEACVKQVTSLGEDSGRTYIPCMKNGLIKIESERLRSEQITLSAIAVFLSQQLGLPQPEKLPSSTLWSLGSLDMEENVYTAYFGGFTAPTTAQHLLIQLTRLGIPPAIVFYAITPPPAELANHLRIPLERVLAWEANQIFLDRRRLGNVLTETRPIHQGNDRNCFVRTGDHWTVTFQGKTRTLNNTLGVRYIEYLLRRKGENIHVSELYCAIHPPEGELAEPLSGMSADQLKAQGLSIVDGSSTQMALTPHRKKHIQQYLKGIEEKIEEAKELGNEEEQACLEEERDKVVAQYLKALGLAGKPRQFNTPLENMRKNVGKRIRADKEKIRKVFPELAAHLDCIITGTTCRYAPNSNVSWSFGPL